MSAKNGVAKNVSVVIPTLGGDSLHGTIEQINRGSLVPFEILICIPDNDVHKIKNYSFSNVRVISTSVRGQVAQRAIGFFEAKGIFVMQLDDDIFIDEFCLERMVNVFFKLNDKKIAVCPVYFDGFFENENLLIKNSFYQNLVSPKNICQKIA